jgi:hypothetical protein
MTEHLHGHDTHAEKLDLSQESKQNVERAKAEAAAEHDDLAKSLEALQAHVDQQAISGKEYEAHGNEQNSASQPFGLHRELKSDAYKRSIQKARTQLSAPDRVISRIIHQPAVESVSNVAAATVARPSGMLMGSVFALLGSALLLFMARRYGFTYNYLVMFICFISGFTFGLLVELFWRLVRKPR